MAKEGAAESVVCIQNLTYSYDKQTPNLVGVNCRIPTGARVILVGANGAGKSTLLRILTGQIFLGLEHDTFDVNGNGHPDDQANGVAYLGGVWSLRRGFSDGPCPYNMHVKAREILAAWQEEHIERRNELVRVLGINLDWRMDHCSDGQRKKVRIMIKLLRPFQLCVIDEFTADLDIFSRSRFFEYLSRECEERGAAVVYATHIFDHADAWATHCAFMQLDKSLSPVHALATHAPYHEILSRTGARRSFCPMYTLVLEELERQYREHGEGGVLPDNQCLVDVIMEEQQNELAADRYDATRAGDKRGWASGRLTRQVYDDEREQKRIRTEQLMQERNMVAEENKLAT